MIIIKWYILFTYISDCDFIKFIIFVVKNRAALLILKQLKQNSFIACITVAGFVITVLANEPDSQAINVIKYA